MGKRLELVKVQRVPGGSRWHCANCGNSLPQGTLIAAMGQDRYCARCVQDGQ